MTILRVTRRDFVAGLGSAAAWPLVARGQQRPTPIVGFLSGDSSSRAPMLSFFRDGLNREGFIEGQNIALQFRTAEGQYEKLPALAAELVNQKVSVIIADGAVSAPLAAKQATTTIPIVFFTGSDPVKWGLVASLNRPGGNITGVSISASELLPKRVEIMRELAPNSAAMGLIVNPNNPNADTDVKTLCALGEVGGWTLKVERVKIERDLESAFENLAGERIGALTIGNDALLGSWNQQIATLAIRYKIPTVATNGLASYGPRIGDLYRIVGEYAGRILKGARPSDLPVYYPTQLDLIINLKTAKALGINVPPTLLARADEVIE